MAQYFFDTRDGATLVRDELGLDLDGIDAVREEAAKGLAGIASDAIPDSVARELALDVRDERGNTVLTASLRFEIAVLVA